jgi:hypothetical protein
VTERFRFCSEAVDQSKDREVQVLFKPVTVRTNYRREGLCEEGGCVRTEEGWRQWWAAERQKKKKMRK